jgi:hypothetical protein
VDEPIIAVEPNQPLGVVYQVQQAPTQAKQKTVTQEPIVFVGPTEQQGILHRGQTFISMDALPNAVKKLLETKPVLRSYFCPVSQYTTFQKRTGVPLERSLKRSRTTLAPKRARKGLIR